jgi:predicted ATPase/DNA-binding SARP family transcriptional activator
MQEPHAELPAPGVGVGFAILGPLEVFAPGGESVPLGSALQRRLLAALLVEPGRALGVHELIDALWPDNPPASSLNAIQVQVSKLRALLGSHGAAGRADQLLVTAPEGYRLAPGSGGLDAERFERLVERGRAALGSDPRRACVYLEDALALWRGAAFGELGRELFALPAAARLEERRLEAQEAFVNARLELGEHAELLPELAALVARHPLRERLRGQHMLALYRCGRAADALVSYRAFKAALLEEGGLAPGLELAALELAILRRDHSLDVGGEASVRSEAATVGSERVTFVAARWELGGGGRRHEAEHALAAEDLGGHVVKLERGCLAVWFGDAAAAARAALALARGRPVAAAVGVHAAGAVQSGVDEAGRACRDAERLASAARGGQVLLSGAGADMVGEHLPEGAELKELGTLRITDSERPERVAQLVHAGLPGELPPPRPSAEPPNNLPAAPDSFVDRELERAEVAHMIDSARIVTLTGAGGCGKTRLATHVAAEVMAGFPDGAYRVDLATVIDAELVADAVAAALGLGRHRTMPMQQVVLAHLAERRLLLLLDNCEHLVPGCTRLAEEIVVTCPGVRIVATSRELLGARGEHAWVVPPLGLPGSSGEDPARAGSVQLLLERAGLRGLPSGLDEEGTRAAERICRRLDGLPLAIELAAPHIAALGLVEVAARLEEDVAGDARLRLLRGHQPLGASRHDTMENALDWSYGLLAGPERRLLSRLSIFAGHFWLADAEAVAGEPEPGGGTPVAELLPRLVETSMVLAETASGGRVSYRLLEPVRDYGFAKLAESGEAEELGRRHAERFLAVANDAEAGLHGSSERRSLDRLEAAHANLRAALRWAIEHEEAELALGLGGALWWFWYTRAHFAEGRGWLTRALELEGGSPTARAKARQAIAHLAYWQGDHATTHAICEELLDDPEGVDPRWGRGWSAMGLCAAAPFGRGDLDRALELGDQSIAVMREYGMAWEHGYALITYGAVAWYAGRYERAVAPLDEGLRIQRELGQTAGLSAALRYRGIVAGLLGDLERGISLCEQSVVVGAAQDDRSGIVHALNHLATVARYDGDLDRARPVYADALQTAAAIGELLGIVWALHGIAGCACVDGQLELTVRLLAKIRAVDEEIGLRLAPRERENAEEDLSSARAGLSAREFEAAWAAGEVAAPEAAVADALAFAGSPAR